MIIHFILDNISFMILNRIFILFISIIWIRRVLKNKKVYKEGANIKNLFQVILLN